MSWLDLADLCWELDDSLVVTELSSAEALARHEAVVAFRALPVPVEEVR